jgi:hypothetical protein
VLSFLTLTTIHYSLTTNLIGRLVDWKIDRLINLALAARTYTLNAVRSTLTIANDYSLTTSLIRDTNLCKKCLIFKCY